MKSVFLGRKDVIDRVYTDEIKASLKTEAELDSNLVIPSDALETNFELLKNIEYIFSSWGMPTPDSETVKRLFPKLKRIFFAAGSIQTFARPFFENGVKIHSAWAANAVPVAEYTVAQIILANKGFFTTSRYQTHGDLATSKEAISFIDGNFDTRVGIIGVGMIGSEVAKRLKEYNINVVAFDPFLSDERARELSVRKVSPEELFSTCVTISNHLADNERTRGILNGSLFSLMRKNVTFINTGRGRQVVENDLAKFMTEHPFATALLDVTYPEPPEKGSPLYTLPNVILTPHIAGSLGNEVRRMGEYMLDEFRKSKKGEICPYEVTPEMLETMA